MKIGENEGVIIQNTTAKYMILLDIKEIIICFSLESITP